MWANKQHTVLPGTNHHRPQDKLTPAQGKKKKKNKRNDKKIAEKKKTCSKEDGAPWALRVGEGLSLTWTINKETGWRRQEGRPLPSNLGVEKACKSGCHVEHSTRGRREALPHKNCKQTSQLEKASMAPPPPVCLEKRRHPRAAKLWHTRSENVGGPTPHMNSK
jgi:hypothetical protein